MNKRVISGVTTRRGFLRGAAAAAAAAFVVPRVLAGETGAAAAALPRPNSVIDGVRIGTISYSYRGCGINTAEQTLKALCTDGLSQVELMGGPIISYIRTGTDGKKLTPDEQIARCADLKKMYNDAGVNIHLHKNGFGKSDEEIEFNFRIAKALGCKGITLERSVNMAKKLAPFAEKHQIWVVFHNHTSNYPVMDKMDPILDYGKYIGFNFDVGHYVAGTKGKSPIPVIEKYHDRIVSLHLKDRTAKGGNVAFGEGDTPLKEILQLLKTEKWPIYGDIELEYKVPAGSTPVAEVAKCVAYCRKVLA